MESMFDTRIRDRRHGSDRVAHDGDRVSDASGTHATDTDAGGLPQAPDWLGTQLTDITEDDILEWCPDILDALLADHATGGNIIWATDSHEGLGDGYGSDSQMLPGLVTGERRGTVRPRVTKAKEEQAKRTKGKAEVFTPSWICNMQNNVVDRAWFGTDGDGGSPFNEETDGGRGWEPTTGDIPFPDEPGDGDGLRSWQAYVKANRMEMACGEAPYLASRYDTTTGETISIERRIGLLDRKLRVVRENTMDNDEDWREWALVALRSCYGFEYQGDSLLIARENMLYDWADAYRDRLGHAPSTEECLEVVDIVSWNIFQMDGFTYCVPGTETKSLLMNWEKNAYYPFEEQIRHGA